MELTKLSAGFAAMMVVLAIAMAAHPQSNPRYIRFAGVRVRFKGRCSPRMRHRKRPTRQFGSCTGRRTWSNSLRPLRNHAGQYGNSVKGFYDYAGHWINKRC